jgi:hypothetical protein
MLYLDLPGGFASPRRNLRCGLALSGMRSTLFVGAVPAGRMAAMRAARSRTHRPAVHFTTLHTASAVHFWRAARRGVHFHGPAMHGRTVHSWLAMGRSVHFTAMHRHRIWSMCRLMDASGVCHRFAVRATGRNVLMHGARSTLVEVAFVARCHSFMLRTSGAIVPIHMAFDGATVSRRFRRPRWCPYGRRRAALLHMMPGTRRKNARPPELAGAGRCRNRRTAVVQRSEPRAVDARRAEMLGLQPCCRHVRFARRDLFFGSRPHRQSAAASVIADA